MHLLARLPLVLVLLAASDGLRASAPAAFDDAIYTEMTVGGSNVSTEVFHLGPDGLARRIYGHATGPATDYEDRYTASEELTYTYAPTAGSPEVATLTLSGGTLAYDRVRTLTFFDASDHEGTFAPFGSFTLRVRTSPHGMANASNRLWLHPGEINITGFVLTEPRLVLVRGIGPSLARFGVDTPASGTSITLFAARISSPRTTSGVSPVRMPRA